MSELQELLEQILDQELIQLILSNTRDAAQGEKLKVRPVLIKEKLYFQETLYLGTKVFHTNRRKEDMKQRLEACLDKDGLFRQAQIHCESMDAVVLVSRKGAVSIKKKNKNATRNNTENKGRGGEAGLQKLSHDRAKQ